MKMNVYVNGYGLRPFRATEKNEYDGTLFQLKGQYKLPKNVRMGDGKKWVDLDFWFSLDQIFDKPEL